MSNDEQRRELIEAVQAIAADLGISVEEVGKLTWSDLEAIASRATARADQEVARKRDLHEVQRIVGRYPDALATGATMGEVVQHMSDGDAARFRELADRLDLGSPG